MSILRLSGIRREFGTLTILDGVTAAIAAGDRTGLVGPNGAGKTTLLRIAAGLDEPDAGDVHRRRGASLGLLLQESHLDAAFMAAPTIRTAVRAGAADLERMERALRELEIGGRIGDGDYERLQHEFEARGGYSLDQRVEAALSGLGFERAEWDRPPDALSGGQQTRATLARLVVADPDILLLDEPTNHLDIAALEWLEDHLRRRSGAVVVASHDRAFLDATVSRVWELRDRRLTVFRGDYSAYHRQRVERDAREAKDAAAQGVAIARERDLVARFRSHRKFGTMHEHEARLERLVAGRSERPRSTRRLRLGGSHLDGSGPARSGETVVTLEDVVIGYSARRPGLDAGPAVAVARAPWLVVARGDRIGIVGPNGAGKSTLLRTIAGDIPPLDGRLALGHATEIGYLAQLREAAIAGSTVLDALLRVMPVTPGEARSYLARFLFRGDDVDREVRVLSGGERSRLELALLGATPFNLLLLDEPTNHLDIAAREAIEEFLAGSQATILLVSHDRRLLEATCDRLWVVDDGLAVAFDGGYRAWRTAVADGWTPSAARDAALTTHRPGSHRPVARVERSGPVAEMPPGQSGGSAVATVTRSRPPRERLSKDQYQRRKALVEADLTRLGLRKSHLELALGDPGVTANFIELRRVSSELADVEAALATAEEAWLELEGRAP